jgi:aspartyl-tRNA(Asn)/glutamyl-tRNA(Gln) amidotransferase subunit A
MSPEEDLQVRRQILRQCIDQTWQVDLAEAAPPGGFRFDRETATAAHSPAPTAPRQIPNARAGELARAYRAGELSPVAVATRSLDQAEATQPTLNAFITILRESALAAAKASEERWRRGQPLGPLDGIPVAVKDLIHIAGAPTTSASKIMAGYVAAEDAPVIQRLKAAGAILIGKTNLHEFAYGGTGDVSAYGPSRNPRNPEHMTGGSSSGSGAAVAAGICPIALGTDTAGSVRIPSALCGIVGLKATYGRVPTAGVIPLSWSLDHVGPMAATVADAALALSVMSGVAMPALEPFTARLKIGVSRELFFQRLDAEVRSLVEDAIGDFGEVHETPIPHIRQASAAQALITASEARAFHKRWLATRADAYDWSVRNRLEAAADVGGADYVQACRLRGLLIQEMSAALADVDVLAMPTVAIPAPKLGQREVRLEDGPADAVALMVRNTGPINFTGFPAITVPCGSTSAGLPVGLQLVAPPWQEARLLQVAHAFENRTSNPRP